MRRHLLPLAMLSMTCAAMPLQAQDVTEAADVTLQRRADALNDRIDIAVKEHKLSKKKAARMHLAVRRVQVSAGNSQSRKGTIAAGELEQFNQQLSDVEVQVPGA